MGVVVAPIEVCSTDAIVTVEFPFISIVTVAVKFKFDDSDAPAVVSFTSGSSVTESRVEESDVIASVSIVVGGGDGVEAVLG